MAFATITDYETRYPLDLEDVDLVEAWLADAESLVREFAGDRFDTTVPGWITTLVCEMVHRKRNQSFPAVHREELGPLNMMYYDAPSGFWLTEDEIQLVWAPVVA